MKQDRSNFALQSTISSQVNLSSSLKRSSFMLPHRTKLSFKSKRAINPADLLGISDRGQINARTWWNPDSPTL